MSEAADPGPISAAPTKLVLVTGGSRGIGAAVCRAAAREGYRVAINYNHSRAAAEALARERADRKMTR
ncbi:MAG: SDR family NAD(P)-dependent oxidoreductase, partial [Casimicrobiaceae bacterium]